MQKMVKRVSRVMKDSGDERIAFIPNEWGLIKLKYIVDCNKDVLRETTDRNYSFRYVDIGSVSLEKGIEKYERVSFGDSPSRARRIVHKGDVIVSTVRTYLKAIANIDDADNVIVSTGFAVLSPRIVDPLFLEYACKSHYFTENVTIESTGISYPAINSTKLLQLKIAVPSKEEQVIIGQILHDRIKEIDRVIEQTKLTIEDYKILKQSIITEAVTKGLDKNVEMKDSGVDWIGGMPNHWQLSKLKYEFRIKKDIAGTEGYDILSVTQKGLKVKDITVNEGQMAADYSKYQFVTVGDYVMNHMDLLTGWVDYAAFNGVTSPDYRVFYMQNPEKNSPEYYKHIFQTCYKNKVFYGLAQGVSNLGRWRLQADKFLNFYIPIPPKEEQDQITDYIVSEQKRYDEIINKKEMLLIELEQYKKSIIYEYVTGKKEVE